MEHTVKVCPAWAKHRCVLIVAVGGELEPMPVGAAELSERV